VRYATEATVAPALRKQPVRRKPKPQPLRALVREPTYEDADILTTGCLAEVFGVTVRTVRRWADATVLPSFRTVGGQRRFAMGRGSSRD
jgi:excisionase family DNA binding protein